MSYQTGYLLAKIQSTRSLIQNPLWRKAYLKYHTHYPEEKKMEGGTSFFLQSYLFREITIIKHGKPLWYLGIQRELLVQRCCNLYWICTFEETLHMPTLSLPTEGFMHVNVAQWIIPLVRNPRNYCETGSSVLGCLLVFWWFPTSARLRCLSLMKWKAANRLPNSSAFLSNEFFSKPQGWAVQHSANPFLKDSE